MALRLETISDYYNRISEEQAKLMNSTTFEKDKAHFNISPRKYCGFKCPYSRRDYYNVSLFIGEGILRYGNTETHVTKPILFIPSPNVSYRWECKTSHQEGFFCLFNQQFFSENKEFDVFKKTSLFKDWSSPIIELKEEQIIFVDFYFREMYRLNQSNYPLKYHNIRNHLAALLHFVLELEGKEYTIDELPSNVRLFRKFDELLNNQFPLGSPANPLLLKSPSDFASQLNVHVNHLNSSIKSVTGQTTTQILKKKIVEESKKLLMFTDWDISQVGYTLGFDEPAYFNNFFKKYTNISPLKYRQEKYNNI
ncbi:helix-turn-helix transcriptional regulator [Chishuiella sp.]|uniref:helix-turn-helix domain-containing protein n=1 Tax=Chishuiella sp. TaxID=1969467 RepID=UPI0028AD0D19|nr:helix-turn-helix transcriptional regulator [Chishuiella sp.]